MAKTKKQLDEEIALATLTDNKIRSLRREAEEAHDYDTGGICDLALDGKIDMDDYTTVSPKMSTKLRTMTAREARLLCAKAIANGRG